MVADVAATLVIFAFASLFRNSSFYDAYWSVAPPLLFLYWHWGTTLDLRTVLLGLLVTAWSIRLTHNWARGWQGLQHEDWRYQDLRYKTGIAYPLVDLMGIQMMPTLVVFAGCLPLWLISQHEVVWHWSEWGWVIIGTAAVTLEWRADNVLHAFRQNSQRTVVLATDVWAWCRHPNYLGELGFWLALALAGWQVTGDWLAWLGFIIMLALFKGISIPMIDKRQLANKPEYAAYHASVWALIPRPPKVDERAS